MLSQAEETRPKGKRMEAPRRLHGARLLDFICPDCGRATRRLIRDGERLTCQAPGCLKQARRER